MERRCRRGVVAILEEMLNPKAIDFLLTQIPDADWAVTIAGHYISFLGKRQASNKLRLVMFLEKKERKGLVNSVGRSNIVKEETAVTLRWSDG